MSKGETKVIVGMEYAACADTSCARLNVRGNHSLFYPAVSHSHRTFRLFLLLLLVMNPIVVQFLFILGIFSYILPADSGSTHVSREERSPGEKEIRNGTASASFNVSDT